MNDTETSRTPRGTGTGKQRVNARVQASQRKFGGYAVFGAAIFACLPVFAAEPVPPKNDTTETFNPSLLPGSHQKTLDISRFERGNPVEPGSYHVDIYVNDSWAGLTNVVFRADSPDSNAAPCMNHELLVRANADLSKITPDMLAKLSDTGNCVQLENLIPQAKVFFNSSDQRLDITIPQEAQRHVPRGYVDPEFWDKGINAATLNYNFNAYRSDNQSSTQSNAYLGVDGGINLGDWHFRQSSAFNWNADSGSSRQNIATYVQHNLPELGAQLTLGDSYTPADIFDTIPVRGVQLSSDDRMLPNSRRGYAPTVRGIAETNARVTVRQNNIVIYETTVSPGPFEINDLYAIGSGGDLNVTVTEADGRQRSFLVPYSAVAQLLRPGVLRFNLTAGKLRDSSLQNAPDLVQATVQRGMNNIWTAYAGVAGFNGYRTALIGAAVNLPAGAVAVDVAASNTEIPQANSESGKSLRLSYSITVPKTETIVNVVADRYSSRGFFSLSDAATLRDEILSFQPVTLEKNRNRLSVSLTQRFGEHGGSLYLTGTTQNYWDRDGADTQFQLGYNNNYRQLNYNLSVTRSKNLISNTYITQYYLGLSMPIVDGLGHADNVSASVTRNVPGHSLTQAAYNGTAGERGEFSYGVAAAEDGGGNGESASVTGEYRGPYGKLDASLAKGSGYSQQSFSAAGSVVAHDGTVTLGQSLGETIGIVEASDASGAEIMNMASARIDAHGYAVVPYLIPYVSNPVEISPKGLPLDVQLDSTSQEVAPYAGAVVKLQFKTSNKHTAIIQTGLPDGSPLPFGAQVFDASNLEVGVVSQGGRIFARVENMDGSLAVRWHDNDEARTCTLQYHLPSRKGMRADAAYDAIHATCLPGSAVANAEQRQLSGVK